MKKIISLSIMLILTLCFSTSAFALDVEPVEPTIPDEPYSYTRQVQSTLSISNKKATCSSVVIGIPGEVNMIRITQYLQKKNGSSWTTVASWVKTFYTTTASFINTKSSLSSGTYRVFTSAAVYHNTAFPEFVTAYSTLKTCWS